MVFDSDALFSYDPTRVVWLQVPQEVFDRVVRERDEARADLAAVESTLVLANQNSEKLMAMVNAAEADAERLADDLGALLDCVGYSDHAGEYVVGGDDAESIMERSRAALAQHEARKRGGA